MCDLAKDPHEMHNLYQDPAYKQTLVDLKVNWLNSKNNIKTLIQQ
nr:hypothetical protein [Pedobacter arcticus]